MKIGAAARTQAAEIDVAEVAPRSLEDFFGLLAERVAKR